jgi:hypothetical protein
LSLNLNTVANQQTNKMLARPQCCYFISCFKSCTFSKLCYHELILWLQELRKWHNLTHPRKGESEMRIWFKLLPDWWFTWSECSSRHVVNTNACFDMKSS